MWTASVSVQSGDDGGKTSYAYVSVNAAATSWSCIHSTLCIDNPQPPYKRVMVRGHAEFMEGHDWEEMGRRMVLRYLGPQGMDYFEATLDLPRVVVRIVPERVTSWNGGGVDRTFTKPAVWHDVAPGQRLEEAASS